MSSRASGGASAAAEPALNLAAVAGRLCRPAAERLLPSGDRLVALEVSVAGASGRLETVPVVWADPPAWASALDVGEPVVVTGRVRRWFFRAGGSTQSRTELVADVVVPARQASRARAALEAVGRRLSPVPGSAGEEAGRRRRR